MCEGCEHVIFYNLPILIFYNGSPIFTGLNILDINKLKRLLNNYSEGRKCNICYELYLRGHFCRNYYYKGWGKSNENFLFFREEVLNSE